MKGKAVLYLEDGSLYEGSYFGHRGEQIGEVVFNTSMTGYEEILTDPSYCGQIVTMCYPHIGNYGINLDDSESYRIWASGLIVKEYSRVHSHYKAQMGLSGYLESEKITGIEGIDTRSLVRRIRSRGSMKGIISALDFDTESLKGKLDGFPDIKGRNLVGEVNDSGYSVYEKYDPKEGSSGKKVVLIDYGLKMNIVRNLEKMGLNLKILSGKASLDDVLSHEPDGVFLSNGPGDPAAVDYGISLASDLIDYNRKKRLPVAGVCMGHQLIGLGAGAKSYKLKFGHHGANHPVKNLRTGQIEITTQNHGFCIDTDTLPDDFEISHINLNDKTSEGIRHKELPVLGYQFHPEAGPGPNIFEFIFSEFKEILNAEEN